MAPNVYSPWITIHKWNSTNSLRNKKLEQAKSNGFQIKPIVNQKTTPSYKKLEEIRPFQPRADDPIQFIDAELAKLREAPSKVSFSRNLI